LAIVSSSAPLGATAELFPCTGLDVRCRFHRPMVSVRTDCAKTFTSMLGLVMLNSDGDEYQAIDFTNPFTWREFS
jgi:hypothetical protein